MGESLLRQTLEEEKETDEKLTDLANSINFEAAASEQAVEGKNGRKNAKAART